LPIANEDNYHQSGSLTANGRTQKGNPKLLAKIVSLLVETASTPFEGTGKPEPLKHDLKGKWSRRITDEHRLV